MRSPLLVSLVQKLLRSRSWGGYRAHLICYPPLRHLVLCCRLPSVWKLLFHMYMFRFLVVSCGRMTLVLITHQYQRQTFQYYLLEFFPSDNVFEIMDFIWFLYYFDSFKNK